MWIAIWEKVEGNDRDVRGEELQVSAASGPGEAAPARRSQRGPRARRPGEEAPR